MKTINDLLTLANKAIIKNQNTINVEMTPHWFINYSGHINKMDVRYYQTGWSKDKELYDVCSINLKNENEIQEMYWFIKNRL